MRRTKLPISPHRLDAFISAAIAEQQRVHLERVAADEGYRLLAEEWKSRYQAHKEEEA